ncbi:hypothetical protein Y1Q_0001599 [Alligator mississippiensis]|uniref:Reverse transcriptase domain-containing protein n=1 Tax=Alligator mississippiensis TaxID=8496 RepID=A0A151MA58_ALLMI|nr:hypothetical protein Y1Q_0001599 [Alligator mississippiensis]
MASVIGPEQSYCVLGRTIQDNLFLLCDLLTAAERFGLDIGLVSLDQEKAFDHIDHQYLLSTLEAFGFGPFFIVAPQVLYHDASSLLKVNSVLCSPFPVHCGIHQGCPLSGMLYALAIELLLHAQRCHLTSLALPPAPDPTTGPLIWLTVYVVDVTVFLGSQEDVRALVHCQHA